MIEETKKISNIKQLMNTEGSYIIPIRGKDVKVRVADTNFILHVDPSGFDLANAVRIDFPTPSIHPEGASADDLVKCPHCDGKGEIEAIIEGVTAPVTGRCGVCRTAGEITAEYAGRVVRGEVARLRRILLGVSLEAEAKRIGVSAQRLRIFEWGNKLSERIAAKIIAAQ